MDEFKEGDIVYYFERLTLKRGVIIAVMNAHSEIASDGYIFAVLNKYLYTTKEEACCELSQACVNLRLEILKDNNLQEAPICLECGDKRYERRACWNECCSFHEE